MSYIRTKRQGLQTSGNIFYTPIVSLPPKETVYKLKQKDKDLLSALDKREKREEKQYSVHDYSSCYALMNKMGKARHHICGGSRTSDKKMSEKCLRCQFFFSVPTFTDVTGT